MIASEGIKAVTFDAAGTLFFPKPSVGEIYQEVIADYGLRLDPADLERSFHSAFRSTVKDHAIADFENREQAYWRSIVASAIGSITMLPSNFETIFQALWDEFAKGSRWRLNNDSLEILDFLDSRQIPFALLTNWDRRVRSVISDHQLQHRFSEIFISSEIGFEKPNPGIFDFAANSLRVSPSRILHVGDNYEQDVLGARQSGWNAAHLTTISLKRTVNNSTISRLLDLRRLLDPS